MKKGFRSLIDRGPFQLSGAGSCLMLAEESQEEVQAQTLPVEQLVIAANH
jgi:hypothetical protein